MSQMKNYVDVMKERLAIEMMVKNGWKLDEKDKYPIEWDATREDSQYAMMIDEADYAVDAVLNMIQNLTPDDVEEDEEDLEEESDSIFDEHGYIKRSQTNTTSAALYIFMDAGYGKPRYVKDVREWLAKVDAARIPDDTEIEGTLHLAYDVDLENIERIECLECGEKDLLLTTHNCIHA